MCKAWQGCRSNHDGVTIALCESPNGLTTPACCGIMGLIYGPTTAADTKGLVCRMCELLGER